MKRTLYIIFLSVITVFAGCEKTPVIDETMIDSGVIQDPSIANPEKYLVSYNPQDSDRSKPVIIAVHGYSATTFEWDEFKQWSDSIGDYYTSQVLLGGHGRSYEAFKQATWQDWQKPVLDEYNRLVSLGFKNISLIGSSTAGPLILNLIYNNRFNPANLPKHVIFIDPIVVSSNKSLYLVDIAGPLIGYAETSMDPKEQGHYYKYRPQESLNQLLDVLNVTRAKLEEGVTLPTGVTLTVYKSKQDGAADPVSAVMLYKGIKTSDGNHIRMHMVDSRLHVFTNLHGRATYTQQDKALQLKTFNDLQILLNH